MDVVNSSEKIAIYQNLKSKEIKILDAFIQNICSYFKSEISNKKDCIGHHIIHRADRNFRWDIENILIITSFEHTLIHSKDGYEKEIQNNNQTIKDKYLNILKRKETGNIKSLQDCIIEWLTKFTEISKNIDIQPNTMTLLAEIQKIISNK